MNQTLQCLPLAHFDADHLKDLRIEGLVQKTSEVCLDLFQGTAPAMSTIDEVYEEERDEEIKTSNR